MRAPGVTATGWPRTMRLAIELPSKSPPTETSSARAAARAETESAVTSPPKRERLVTSLEAVASGRGVVAAATEPATDAALTAEPSPGNAKPPEATPFGG